MADELLAYRDRFPILRTRMRSLVGSDDWLARTCLLANDRKRAVQAVRGGLKIDRNNPHLVALYKELGIRSHPVLRFLDRAHPINQLLGRLRHAIRGGP